MLLVEPLVAVDLMHIFAQREGSSSWEKRDQVIDHLDSPRQSLFTGQRLRVWSKGSIRNPFVFGTGEYELWRFPTRPHPVPPKWYLSFDQASGRFVYPPRQLASSRSNSV
jgi:hypothetical protein